MNKSFLAGQNIFVTGACGTIGSRLIEYLLQSCEVGSVIGIDNNESALFFTDYRFQENDNASFMLADVRDMSTLSRLMRGVDIVFHVAAFKHVIMCERSPYEAVQTNIVGTQNVLLAARENDVQKIIFTSSDKAVNPTNVMGTSKLMGERLVTAANVIPGDNPPVCASTRFGNVLGSSGSVIPIFAEQIRNGGPVTLTDPDMTRFIMSIDRAVELIINSAAIACGGEIFVTKMPTIRIIDLAEVMIRELAPVFGHSSDSMEIKTIGIKPGEKMYEELMSLEETQRSWELSGYFAVLPAFRGMYSGIDYNYETVVSNIVDKPYHSGTEEPLSQAELKNFMLLNNLLEPCLEPERHPQKRYWPGDKEARKDLDANDGKDKI